MSLSTTNKKFLYLQTFLLAVGTIFSWSTLIEQFQNFYALYGTLLRFENCATPNPLATPCFYGAAAFLVAFVWSAILLGKYSERSGRYLRYLIIFGTVFAFSVLAYETAQYYHLFSGPQISCKIGVSPIETPCFVGALIYLVGSVVAQKLKGASQE